jgi:hypothetical protein
VILHGGDTLIRSMSIYLAVTPCGRACSVDRFVQLYRAKSFLPPIRVSVWGQRLISYNVALVYFTTLWLKWDGDKWRRLTAAYYPERLAEFYRFPVPDFFKSLFVARIATFGTIVVEFLLGTLVFFPPARKWVLVAGVLMHSYIEYTMNIPLFSFMIVSCYVTFYNGEEISGFFQRLGLRLRRFHVTVRLPQGKRLRPAAAGFLAAVDPLRMVAYLPGQDEEWRCVSYDGAQITAVRALRTRCLGLWVISWLPGLLPRYIQGALEDEHQSEAKGSPAVRAGQ